MSQRGYNPPVPASLSVEVSSGSASAPTESRIHPQPKNQPPISPSDENVKPVPIDDQEAFGVPSARVETRPVRGPDSSIEHTESESSDSVCISSTSQGSTATPLRLPKEVAKVSSDSGREASSRSNPEESKSDLDQSLPLDREIPVPLDIKGKGKMTDLEQGDLYDATREKEQNSDTGRQRAQKPRKIVGPGSLRSADLPAGLNAVNIKGETAALASSIGFHSEDYEHHRTMDASRRRYFPADPTELQKRRIASARSAKAKRIEVPALVRVTDFDRGHDGIEILILPEPFDEDTSIDASMSFPAQASDVSQFAVLLMELARRSSQLYASKKSFSDTVLRKRVSMLRALIDTLRGSVSLRQSQDPTVGLMLVQYGTLEMLQVMGWACWSSISKQKATETQYDGFVDVTADLTMTLAQNKDILAKSILDGTKHNEKTGTDNSTDQSIQDGNQEIRKIEQVLSKAAIVLRQELSNPRPRQNDIEEVIRAHISLHTTPLTEIKRASGWSPAQYAPDVAHSWTSLRLANPQVPLYDWAQTPGYLTYPWPELLQVKYHQPAHILTAELNIDAAEAICGFRGQNHIRENLRLPMLPEPMETPADGQIRNALPKGVWNAQVLDYSKPGRRVVSNQHGIYSWKFPRKTLQVIRPLKLPFSRQCFTGQALAYFDDPNIIYEEWRYNSDVGMVASVTKQESATRFHQVRSRPAVQSQNDEDEDDALQHIEDIETSSRQGDGGEESEESTQRNTSSGSSSISTDPASGPPPSRDPSLAAETSETGTALSPISEAPTPDEWPYTSSYSEALMGGLQESPLYQGETPAESSSSASKAIALEESPNDEGNESDEDDEG
ncbi:hypothetical protein ABW19_dt0203726 [Dactylella cylindrospora]|nr:hypothetical protein ABW19_dt0203726 [Dactylella cylindrospora]